jgi:hypothetical protein
MDNENASMPKDSLLLLVVMAMITLVVFAL